MTKLLKLLKLFTYLQEEQGRNVKRLVRGLGAATAESRTGFYTTLVALLSSSADYPSLETLFSIMDATLSVGVGSNLDKVCKLHS